MTPDRYEAYSNRRQELSGIIQKRGTKLSVSPWAAFVFGGLFVAVGTPIILVGAKVLEINSASVHAPYWVLTVAGATFVMGGFMPWGSAWKQAATHRQCLEASRRYPNEPALVDYPWHPDGFEVSEWPGVAKSFALAIGLTVFLSIFNWWAFAANGPRMVKGVVTVFDLIAAGTWWLAARQLGRAFKFGHSRIEFPSFPCRLPGTVIVRWHPFGGINHVNKGTFTLRCVEERMETRGVGNNQRVVLVHEQIGSTQGFFEQPRHFQLQEKVELRYELPSDAQPTRLAADKPIFWELEVKLDLPGLDFNEIYLVPVYSQT
jgi:hypothetical protein